jgi:GNAT superfamily N-acetyltransferase
MRLLLSRSTVEARPELMIEFLRAIAEDTEFLRANYPRFDEWLLGKVIPGIYQGDRTVLIEQRDSVVAGLLIVKHSEHEKKLCTLRIRPHFESRGLGVRLFEAAFDLLGTERPLLSVSESLRPKFLRLFTHFGFAQEAVYEGRYLPRVDEFSYNGLLDLPPKRRFPPHSCQHLNRDNDFKEMFAWSLMEKAPYLQSCYNSRSAELELQAPPYIWSSRRSKQ